MDEANELSSIGDLEISKRQLLGVLGASLAMNMVPGVVRKAWAQQVYDLIVIGAGNAGLPAALFAADRGAEVLVIEKAPRLGGTLDRTGGQMSAAGTRLQASRGIEDTPEAHFDDVMRLSKGTADPDMVRLATDNAAASLDWLMDHGFEVYPEHPVFTLGHDAYSNRRYQWGYERGISILKALMPSIEEHVRAGRIRFLIRTSAVELIQAADGSVLGVVVEDGEGGRQDYLARQVAITAGGYCGSAEYFRELHGVPLYARLAFPYNRGAGVKLGLGAGGYLTGVGKLLTSPGNLLEDENYPSPLSPFFSTRPSARMPWEVWVNQQGKRFVREDHESVLEREIAVSDQSNQRFWVVFDHAIREAAPPFGPHWTQENLTRSFDRHHMFAKANSVRELAYWIGVDENALVETIDEYNRMQARGRDSAFERKHMPLPVATPPFYAIRLQGTSVIAPAGLKVDTRLRVLRKNGDPIPNLFAGGETLGKKVFNGAASVAGMMVTPALTTGRLIGQKFIELS